MRKAYITLLVLLIPCLGHANPPIQSTDYWLGDGLVGSSSMHSGMAVGVGDASSEVSPIDTVLKGEQKRYFLRSSVLKPGWCVGVIGSDRASQEMVRATDQVTAFDGVTVKISARDALGLVAYAGIRKAPLFPALELGVAPSRKQPEPSLSVAQSRVDILNVNICTLSRCPLNRDLNLVA